MTPVVGGVYSATGDENFTGELEKILPKSYGLLRDVSQLPHHSFIAVADLDTVGPEEIKKLSGRTFVIAAGTNLTNERIISATLSGAYDVVCRPFAPEIVAALMSELQEVTREVALSLPTKNPAPTATCAIVGSSPAITEVCKKLARLSQVDVPMLITGETGTGKELIAESVAQTSQRFGKPFVVVNCAAVPEALLESELFGFEKGAFTGATSAKHGLLKIADGGVVFFDEIGELPLVLQGKLLRFIQTQTFYTLGSTKEVTVDVRVISATNRNLSAMVREGKFREDLYHRLRVATIHTPPLRERKDDILPLMQFFIYRYSRLLKKPVKHITCAFLRTLMSYDWPGNIRELENALRSAIAFSKSPFLTTHDLAGIGSGGNEPEVRGREDSLEVFVSAYLREAVGNKEKNIYRNLHGRLDWIIFHHIVSAHTENISEISRLLGLNRITVRKKLAEATPRPI